MQFTLPTGYEPCPCDKFAHRAIAIIIAAEYISPMEEVSTSIRLTLVPKKSRQKSPTVYILVLLAVKSKYTNTVHCSLSSSQFFLSRTSPVSHRNIWTLEMTSCSVNPHEMGLPMWVIDILSDIFAISSAWYDADPGPSCIARLKKSRWQCTLCEVQ